MTDVLGALKRAAGYADALTVTFQTAKMQQGLQADAALLRDLAQRITDYREASTRWVAARSAYDQYHANVAGGEALSALLALVRGGEAAPTTHEEAR